MLEQFAFLLVIFLLMIFVIGWNIVIFIEFLKLAELDRF